MKTQPSGSFPGGGSRWIRGAGIAFGFATILAIAAKPNHESDIAVYERLMAEAKPGQDYVICGDYGLTVMQLQAFHDQLVAQRGGIQPNFSTPPNPIFKWPGGNVSYRFNVAQVGNGTITAAKMRQFRDSANEWGAFANLHFAEFAGTPPANYITVSEDPSLSGGFSSSVGMAGGGGEQTISIGPASWNRGTVCHEIGHALGLFHEQQRDDRDTYVTILTANIQSGAEANFTLIPGGTADHGRYDFYSVMHYSRNALSVDPPNKDTIDPKPAYIQFINIMGRVTDRTLSKLDRAGIAEVYGNPVTPPDALVTNTNDSGSGSLRTAIYYAFDRSTDMPAVPTAILFHLPLTDSNYNSGTGVFTIAPSFGMTAPGVGTTLDGATQTTFTGNTNPSGPEVMLDGTAIVAGNLSSAGIVLRETGCAVRNLIIADFNADDILFDGATAATNGTVPAGNVVSGCYIGTDHTGTIAVGNGVGSPGIELAEGPQNNTIGGVTAALRNIISGNGGYGILARGAGTSGNVISGNYIGTNAPGTAALGNGQASNWAGLAIYDGAQDNIVTGNVISGNTAQGLVIADTNTDANRVTGNFIGTNPAGTVAIPNQWSGVAIYSGAGSNVIGGTQPAARNIISGNGNQGVVIAGEGADSNRIEGNYIGTDVSGTAALPNIYAGVSIFGGAQSNVIGGTMAGAGNVLSGNASSGITISEPTTASNAVQGNYIGLDVTGLAQLANGGSGVDIFGGSHDNTIGGTDVGARNYISGNMGAGIGLSGIGTNSNLVQGNTIGLNLHGAVRPNSYQGVSLFQSDSLDPSGPRFNVIGGTNPGTGNRIAGNTFEGIAMFDPGTSQNSVLGNSIFANHYGGIGMGTSYNHSNNDRAAPQLASAVLGSAVNPGGTDVNGVLYSVASTQFRIEFFANPATTAEGQNFIGATDVTTNGGGSLSFGPLHLAAAVSAGSAITATATDSAGNTSQFSLPVTVTTTDSDSDGIPDTWMNAHFGHPNGQIADLSRAADDADGDGMTNCQEFLAGTDPKHGGSSFHVLTAAHGVDAFSFGFGSVLGKTYRVEASDNLGSWEVLAEPVVGTGGTVTITAPVSPVEPRRFYRAATTP